MTRIAVKRPVTTFMIILIFLAFGVMSLMNLRMDLLPNMNLPYAAIITSYVGASPEQIEQLVTEPLERSMARLSGLEAMYSTSSENMSIVALQFEQNVDIDMASLDIREAVDLIKSTLPEDADAPIVIKMDINAMSGIYIAVSSDTDDLVNLKSKVDDQIVDRLVRQEGVASVDVSGGREKEIRINLIEDRLRGYGVSESQIAQLVGAENTSMPIGSLTEAGKNLTIKIDGEFVTVDDINNLPITTPMGGIVYIRDIAEVVETFKDVSSYAYLNGRPAVVMMVSKQSTANTVNVSRSTMRELDRIIAEYPELEISVILDPADYINMSLRSVSSAAVSGVILAIIVLFVFLRNFRSTLVVGTAIPVSILVTFAFMYFADMTINLMSLGGLTLGVGMLVDNSIVVLESIFRRMENGESRSRAAINGAKEVAMSIVASTLTTVAVFVPVAWMGGMIAQVFNDLALSIGFALTASLLVALTFVPLTCSLFLSPAMKPGEQNFFSFMTGWADRCIRQLVSRRQKIEYRKIKGFGTFLIRVFTFIKRGVGYLFLWLFRIIFVPVCFIIKYISIAFGFVYNLFRKWFDRLMDLVGRGIDALVRAYRRAIIWSSTHRKITILLAFILFAGSLASAPMVGMELLPAADQSQVDISISMPTGAILERTQDITFQVLERLEGIPEIDNVSTTVGGMSMMGGATDTAAVTVALVPIKERSRSSMEIAMEIRGKVQDIAGAEINVEALTSMMNMGFGAGGDVSYNIKGGDVDTLVQVSDDLIELLGTVSGLRDVTSNLSDTIPQATIKIDRNKASGFGLSAVSVMGIVNTNVSGTTATQYKMQGDEIDIVVGQDKSRIQSIEDIENLLIPTPMGTAVPLREIATITMTESPLSITRMDQEIILTISGTLEGRDLGSVTREIDRLIEARYIFPQGVSIEATGNQQTMNEEIYNMVVAFIIAVFVVYAIMAAEFESMYYPLVIMFAVPPALSTGFLGLFAMGHTFGITAALGMIMLLGIVINNGIVLIDYVNLLRGKGKSLLEAVQEACPVRLRAILMTTLTTTLGLMPMMLGAQEGSEMMQPLATVVVWGLTFSTLITLFLVPCIYISFDNIRSRLFGKRVKFRKIEEI